MAVALALGIGTMIGWRRVAMTIGEKIGKRGMTYAQGVAAQMTAASVYRPCQIILGCRLHNTRTLICRSRNDGGGRRWSYSVKR